MDYFVRYLPNTESDCQRMLEVIGLRRLDDLFESIPKASRLRKPLDLPAPLPEAELLEKLNGMQSDIFRGERWTSLLGGGAYNHFVPAVVRSLAGRSEFYTAYTPYQPEISQGTLQAIFEYQSLICQLTGMEVSNASMYDGASSLAEAVLMAYRVTGKKRVLVSDAVHPEYRSVIRTYLDRPEQMVPIPFGSEDGRTDANALQGLLDAGVAAVVIQSPNFFGIVEDLEKIGRIVKEKNTMFIVGFSEAISYGLLSPPGEFGADIVAGEGQSLGIPLCFGGPYLGIFATRERYVRNMPGRLVGETVDADGKRGYVLTLATREQHIRRERATSNICTNEGLCALMATIFLSCLGRSGLRELAIMNLSKAEYAKNAASSIKGCRIAFPSPTFNEFVLEVDGDPEAVLEAQRKERIIGGISLGRFYPEMKRRILVAVTETLTRKEIDAWAGSLERALRNQPGTTRRNHD